METSSRRFLGILALVACFLIGLGIYLIQRDLQVIVSQRTSSLEQSLFAATALLPQELVVLSAQSKDEESQELRELKASLLNLLTELRLRGRLSVGRISDGKFEILASSDPQWSGGEIQELPLEAVQKIQEGQAYSSPLLKRQDEHIIYSLKPVPAGNGFVLMLSSNETALHYQKAGILLHYLLLGLVLLFAFGFGFYIYMTSSSKRLAAADFLASKLFEESRQPVLILDSKSRLIDANTAFLESMEVVWENIEKRQLSETELFVPLETNWQDVSQKLEKRQNFQIKLKHLNKIDLARYYRLKIHHLNGKSLGLFENITSKTIQSLEDNSFYDKQTQLPNLQYLGSLVESQADRLNLERSCLLLIEVFPLAPEYIQNFIAFLKEYFRQTDLVLSANEGRFAILLAGTELENAYRIAQNLPKLLKESGKAELQNLQINAGLSQLEAGENFTEWVARAEAALMTARQSGPNFVEAQQANALEIIE